MKIKNVFALNTILAIGLLLSACSALKPTPAAQPEPAPTAMVIPVTGAQYKFVTNKLLLPTTYTLTQSFGLNIDDDDKQNTDNKFGDLLTLLTSVAPELEIQSALDHALDNGQLVTLHMLKADDFLNDPSVLWSVYLGQRTQAAPTFDGSDQFTLDSATPLDSPIVGSLTNGRFIGGPGAARIRMLLLGQQVEVDLIGVRLEADISLNGCVEGKLGGGITVEEFRNRLLPAIADGLNQVIAADHSAANPILQTFDSNKDSIISVEELEKNLILMIAISPDLDLLDASNKFNPGQDGVKDSYSIGFGFTCVPADFSVPGE